MKITNTQDGPRGVNTVNGTVLVDPKQTVDVEVYEREQPHIEAAGWFTVKGSYKPDPDAPKPAQADKAAEKALADKDAEIADLKKQLEAKAKA
jgi:hypothetical protein